MSDFTIKNASLSDMDFLISLAKEEGWNPGLQDAVPFYHTDPHGFFIGEINGEKVGCISAVAYDDSFGFMGFYIVIPKYRGKGLGMQLAKHGLNYMGDRCIGLDGVVEQQENYKKSHFQLFYRNIRFKATDIHMSPTSLTTLDNVTEDVLLKYDAMVFGLSRKVFLEKWIHMPNAYSLAKWENEELKGYGVIRQCFEGFKIGPLFADSLDIAKELYHGLVAKAGEGPVFIDVPETNQSAMSLAESLRLEMVFETARMYNRSPPRQATDRVFGITSFELG